MQPTSEIVTVEGRQTRRWLGVTDQGIPVDVFVTRLRVANGQDTSAFERELREMPQPSMPAIDLRFLV